MTLKSGAARAARKGDLSKTISSNGKVTVQVVVEQPRREKHSFWRVLSWFFFWPILLSFAVIKLMLKFFISWFRKCGVMPSTKFAQSSSNKPLGGQALEIRPEEIIDNSQTVDHIEALYSDGYNLNRKMALILCKSEFAQLKKISQDLDNEIIYCPACKHAFDKKPVRKVKCKHCGQYVYKRQCPYPKDSHSKKAIIVDQNGLALVDAIGVYDCNVVDVNVTRRWFDEWIKQTNARYGDSRYAQYEAWTWYQFYHRKLVTMAVKYSSDMYRVDEMMIRVCLSRERTQNAAVGYLVELLSFQWRDYLKERKKIMAIDDRGMQAEFLANLEDNLVMPGVVYLYEDIEAKIGEEKIRTLFNEALKRSRTLDDNTLIIEELKKKLAMRSSNNI